MTERKNEYRSTGDGRTVHDVGGLDFGSIDRHDHDLAFWERRVDAMLVLLATKKEAFKIDAMRRVIEGYNEQQYDSTAYYEKWVVALSKLLLEQEMTSHDELLQRFEKARDEIRKSGRQVSDDDMAAIVGRPAS